MQCVHFTCWKGQRQLYVLLAFDFRRLDNFSRVISFLGLAMLISTYNCSLRGATKSKNKNGMLYPGLSQTRDYHSFTEGVGAVDRKSVV